jgi:hypothetical protein
MGRNIATVISYCTNDYRYLAICIEEAKKFSSQIIVVVADHFFNGVPENRELLERSYAEHPDCLFVEFEFDPKRLYGTYCPYSQEDADWIKYWHSTSRYVGYHYLDKQTEYVNFLDVDEIIEGERFLAYLNQFAYRDYAALRFLSYFYFREPSFRATTFAPNFLLVRKSAISSPEMLLTVRERKGIFDTVVGKKILLVGPDDKPLVHHYSWVRTKEELLFKVKSWGHSLEKNWTALIEEEFSHPFRGREVIHGLNSYETVSPRFDPFQETERSRSHRRKHVRKVNPRTLLESVLGD